MDGTVWTDSDIIQLLTAPTEGDDVIYGGIGDDTLRPQLNASWSVKQAA